MAFPSTPASRPCQLHTRLAQATKGRESISFYTLPEYEEWKESNNTRGWTIKYYKVRPRSRGVGCLEHAW